MAAFALTKSRITAAALLAGVAALLYRFPPDQFAFYPACPIHQYTGLLCPGCGVTRALAALLHGQFAAAFHLNPLFVLALPFVFTYAVYTGLNGKPVALPRPMIYSLLCITALFTIIRNIT